MYMYNNEALYSPSSVRSLFRVAATATIHPRLSATTFLSRWLESELDWSKPKISTALADQTTTIRQTTSKALTKTNELNASSLAVVKLEGGRGGN